MILVLDRANFPDPGTTSRCSTRPSNILRSHPSREPPLRRHSDSSSDEDSNRQSCPWGHILNSDRTSPNYKRAWSPNRPPQPHLETHGNLLHLFRILDLLVRGCRTLCRDLTAQPGSQVQKLLKSLRPPKTEALTPRSGPLGKDSPKP